MEEICLNLVKIKNKKLVSRLRTAAMAAEEKVKLAIGEIFFIQEVLGEIGRVQTLLIVKKGSNWYYDIILDKLLSPLWGQGDSIYCYDDEGGESVRLHLTLD